ARLDGHSAGLLCAFIRAVRTPGDLGRRASAGVYVRGPGIGVPSQCEEELMKKTWAQKIEDKTTLPKVLKLEKRFPCYNAVHKMGANAGDPVVLVNPSEVLQVMASVPKGRLTTIVDVCRTIAQNHGVAACCSLTTGIFIMAIANAVEDAIASGGTSALAGVPYWRTLKADGFLNEKYPGGLEGHKRHLTEEGYAVVARGKRYQVAGFRTYLMSRGKPACRDS
ncbi:MAG TPA: hypothetical protein VMV94_11140, partial [Phycisphaerae bacterium]|nr:hypothetical protein [Phycisphaerae bacterium]